MEQRPYIAVFYAEIHASSACMLCVLGFTWFFLSAQREDKFRTNPFGADHVDIFSMKLNDLFYDGKAKSRSFLVFSSGQVRLIETFPDFFQTAFQNNLTLFLCHLT